MKIYKTWLITSCDAKRNFPKLSINEKKKKLISHTAILEEILHDLSTLFIENDMTQSWPYEERIQEYILKHIEKHYKDMTVI